MTWDKKGNANGKAWRYNVFKDTARLWRVKVLNREWEYPKYVGPFLNRTQAIERAEQIEAAGTVM